MERRQITYLKSENQKGKAWQQRPLFLHVTPFILQISLECPADIQLTHSHLQGWKLHVLCHLLHGISHPARPQGGMIQTMITSLETQLAAVTEFYAERGCMAACNMKPHSALCPASIAPADV